MIPIRLAHLLVVVVFSVAACTASEQTSPTSPTRPDLLREIGSYDGEYALSTVPDLTVDSHGRIWVLQPIEGRIRIFEMGGELLANVGRKGEGPGEFVSPQWVGTVADTVWVADPAQQRITLFDATGEYIRDERFSIPEAGLDLVPARPGALMADGSIWTFGEASSEALSDGRVNSLPIRRRSRGEEVTLVHMLEVEFPIRKLTFGDRPGAMFLPQPFAWRDHWSVVPDGRGLVLVEQSREENARLTSFSTDGSVREVAELQISNSEISGTAIEHWVARKVALFERFPSWLPDVPATKIYEHLDIPEVFPAIYEVIAGLGGTIWLRTVPYDIGEDVLWIGVHRDGSVEQEIVVPAETQIQFFGSGRAVGVRTDEFDVPFLQVFSF